MGFLDHSTNNIIVDAVLTDKGREALARNDGSFNIYQFSLADDEVDYSIIKQFGRTIGKEKIEKNTPILEAVTQASLGLKYPLLTISNPFLTNMPVMTLTSESSPLSFNRLDSTKTKTLTITIEDKTGSQIEFDLLESELFIELNHLFLAIAGETPDMVHTDNIAVYRYNDFTRDGVSSTAGTTQKINIPISIKTINNTLFNTYSASGQSYIRTYIRVKGVNSGLNKNFEVQIS
jgi:hypothetical protein